MKLKNLLKNIEVQEVRGSREVEISGICSDSRTVAPGNLFIARKGSIFDGNQFIPEAIAAGAIAIVTDIYNPFFENIVQIIHSNPSAIESDLAIAYYRDPSKELFLVGVTGTNGKTTTTYLVKHLLDSLQKKSGLIGTVEYVIGSQHLFSSRTTPDSVTLQKLMRNMVEKECTAAAIEVSSHALDQNRSGHIEWDIVIFTNLTLDHLDYHKTMEEYASAKAKLFSALAPLKNGKKTYAVVNGDDPWSEKMMKDCSAEIITYGMSDRAALRAHSIVCSSKSTEMVIEYKNESALVHSPLIGNFNVYNLLAACAVGVLSSHPLQEVCQACSSFSGVPGRLERISNDNELSIFVDYAHTDDALKNVLTTLRQVTKGRLITVFGCGGDRDRSKRPKMGEVSGKLSDYTIITADNCRSEDPEQICREIIQGMPHSAPYEVLIDREKAIQRAVQMAQPMDMVLIAGKGHETYQVFANRTVAFDDRLVVQEACRQKTQCSQLM